MKFSKLKKTVIFAIINNYKNTSSYLPGCDTDIEKINKYCKIYSNVKLFSLINKTHDQLTEALTNYSVLTEFAENIIIIFSGHGEDCNEEISVILTEDKKPIFPSEIINYFKNKNIYFINDACRAKSTKNIKNYYKIDQEKNILIVYAVDNYEYAYCNKTFGSFLVNSFLKAFHKCYNENSNMNDIFYKILLKILKEKNKFLNIKFYCSENLNLIWYSVIVKLKKLSNQKNDKCDINKINEIVELNTYENKVLNIPIAIMSDDSYFEIDELFSFYLFFMKLHYEYHNIDFILYLQLPINNKIKCYEVNYENKMSTEGKEFSIIYEEKTSPVYDLHKLDFDNIKFHKIYFKHNNGETYFKDHLLKSLNYAYAIYIKFGIQCFNFKYKILKGKNENKIINYSIDFSEKIVHDKDKNIYYSLFIENY